MMSAFPILRKVCCTDRVQYEKERLSLDRMVKNYGSRYGLMECSTEAHGA